jgi:predicted negative regulator of RcsB-dependent stress response
MRSAIFAGLVSFGPALCLAQAEIPANCVVDSASAATAPTITPAANTQFAAARECVMNRDASCAETALDALDEDDLNEDELAVLSIGRGDIESLDGSSRRARREYRRVVRSDDASRQLVALAIERTALVHIDDEDYDDAIDALDDLECGEWTPDLLYIRGRAFFGESEFRAAETSAQTAIDARVAVGGVAPQHWHDLLTTAEQRAIQAETEEVVCRNERSTNSNIPVRVCTTRSQRQAEADATRDVGRQDSIFVGE